MKHVLIENGIVVMQDLTGRIPEGYVEAPDDVFPGYAFNPGAGTFAPPPAPPQQVPQQISDRQFFQQLAIMELISEDDAIAAVATGTLPPAMAAFIDQLPEEQRFAARMALQGATTFIRTNPLVETFGSMQGMTPEQIDDLWRAASAL